MEKHKVRRDTVDSGTCGYGASRAEPPRSGGITTPQGTMETQHSTGNARGFRLGVRGKVALILLATLLVTLTVSSLLTLRAQQRDTLEETERRGRETAHLIAQSLAYSVVGYNYHTLELILQDLVRNRDVVYARVENNRGNIMAVAGTPPAPDDKAQTFIQDIRLDGELLGQLNLSLSSERVIAALQTRQRNALLGQLAAIVVVMVIGFVALSILIIRPLSLTVRTIGTNLNSGSARLERIPLRSNDEFGDLAKSFNALGEHLDEARGKLESRIDFANQELQEAYRKLSLQADELRSMNRELEQLSITDPLTNLFNRRYFEKLMENEVAQSVLNDVTISILLFDIDNLKTVTEQHGQDAGDEILRHVARIITERLRLTDIACRYGGDKFFILCRRATISNAVSIADAMHQAIVEKPVRVHDTSISISVNIGVATIPGVQKVTTADEFFRNADEALRRCKQDGNDHVLHYSMIDRGPRSAAV